MELKSQLALLCLFQFQHLWFWMSNLWCWWISKKDHRQWHQPIKWRERQHCTTWSFNSVMSIYTIPFGFFSAWTGDCAWVCCRIAMRQDSSAFVVRLVAKVQTHLKVLALQTYLVNRSVHIQPCKSQTLQIIIQRTLWSCDKLNCLHF